MGSFEIGSSTHPFLEDATVTLYGEKEDKHMVYVNEIEAGNKIISNVGKMSIYGIQRTERTRLLAKS